MPDWTRLTDENTTRPAYEAWRIECPECGDATPSPYGATDEATKECPACGATIEFAVRAVDD